MAEPTVTIYWDDLIEQEKKEFGPRLDQAASHLAQALQAAWPRSKTSKTEKEKQDRARPRYRVVGRRERGSKKYRGRKKQATADRIHWVPSEDDHLTRLVIVPFPGGYIEGGWHHVGGKLIPARNIAQKVIDAEMETITSIISGGQ